MNIQKLIANIPANNQKIIEVFQKLESGKLNKSPDYQRKKVWRRQHKFEFIDTILKNFPFPEVYIAPEKVDTKRLELLEQIVDGQQRLTAIQDYINGTDVFSQNGSVPLFKDLSTAEKEDFLNYEVSVRYLKNATPDQIKEIFQRINRTDYALNKMERFHAIWGESELVCLAKQMIEKDLEIDLKLVEYVISDEDREWLLKFFVSGEEGTGGLFSDAEINRMLSLQFILVLLTTLINNKYFHRNSEIEASVKAYNESVPDVELLIKNIVDSTKLISEMRFSKKSIWMRQSTLLNLIFEISKYGSENIDKKKLKVHLETVEKNIEEDMTDKEMDKFRNFSKEAVNEKRAREFRSKYIDAILQDCLI